MKWVFLGLSEVACRLVAHSSPINISALPTRAPVVMCTVNAAFHRVLPRSIWATFCLEWLILNSVDAKRSANEPKALVCPSISSSGIEASPSSYVSRKISFSSESFSGKGSLPGLSPAA